MAREPSIGDAGSKQNDNLNPGADQSAGLWGLKIEVSLGFGPLDLVISCRLLH
jgi:hypothetical protein